MKPPVLPKLFTTFAERYANRPGGYTRIHRLDNRFGDNAPIALLELVDNPHDFKLEMTARAVGRELLNEKLRWDSPRGVVNSGVQNADIVIAKELNLGGLDSGELRPTTRRNLQKVMKYRGREALTEIGAKASAYIVRSQLLSLFFILIICEHAGNHFGQAGRRSQNATSS